MYSEKDFQNIQEQLIVLKEDNYKLIDTCHKYENEINAYKLDMSNCRQELDKTQKIIEKNKNYKDNASIVLDYEALQLQMQQQEDEFKLQNGTIMKELQNMANENEELRKLSNLNEFKYDGEKLRKLLNYLDNNNNYENQSNLQSLISDIKTLIGEGKYINLVNEKLASENKFEASKDELIACQHENQNLTQEIGNLKKSYKDMESDHQNKLYSILNTLKEFSNLEINVSSDTIWDRCNTIEQKLVSIYSILKDFAYKQKISMESYEKNISEMQKTYEEKLSDLENRENLQNTRNFELMNEREQQMTDYLNTIDTLKLELQSAKESHNTAKLAVVDLTTQLTLANERCEQLNQEIADLKVLTGQEGQKLEIESKAKDDTITNLKDQLIKAERDCADLKMQLSNDREDHQTRERKLNMQIKDLRRQFLHEKKRAETLQEYLSAPAANKSYPSTPNSGLGFTGINGGFNTSNNLNTTNNNNNSANSNSINNSTFVKSGSPASSYQTNPSYYEASLLSATNNNYSDDDKNSVSSWSLVSNGGTNSHRHGPSRSHFRDNGVSNNNLNGGYIEFDQNLKISSPQLDVGGGDTSCHDDVTLLKERVKYLEESAAGLADDLMRKNQLIEHFIENGEILPTALNSPALISPYYPDHGNLPIKEPPHTNSSLPNNNNNNNNNNNPNVNNGYSVNSQLPNTMKRLISAKFNHFLMTHSTNLNNSLNNNLLNISASGNLSYDELINVNAKLKVMLEETLTKNIMLEKGLENLSKENHIIKNIRSALNQDIESTANVPSNEKNYINNDNK